MELLLVALLYFVPTVVALARDHHQKGAIIILNVFLGWTLIGWVGALVWAATATEARAVAPPPPAFPDGPFRVYGFEASGGATTRHGHVRARSPQEAEALVASAVPWAEVRVKPSALPWPGKPGETIAWSS